MAKAKDLTGQKFGRLEVMGPTDMRKKRYMVWECRCDCEKTTFVPGTYLTTGRIKSCGCLKVEEGIPRPVDLTGQRFGQLLAPVPQKNARKAAEFGNAAVIVEIRHMFLFKDYSENSHNLAAVFSRRLEQ